MRSITLEKGGSAGCRWIGPLGIGLDAFGNLFVGDIVTGFVYKFGPAGGVASAPRYLISRSPLPGKTSARGCKPPSKGAHL